MSPLPSHAGETPSTFWHSPQLHAAIIFAAGIFLWIGCWNSGFIRYDDKDHVGKNELFECSLHDVFFTTPMANYLPMTLVSYRVDRAVFGGWLRPWGMGVRFMNYIYHSIAALLLWQIMLTLGVPRMQAFFIGLIFAVHPLACESVCWASERKNVLAAMFGFAALLLWLRIEALKWRIPVCTVVFGLALLSKPSAMGFLPLFAIVELMGRVKGLSQDGQMFWRPSMRWLQFAAEIAPMALISFGIGIINMRLGSADLIGLPGGSVLNAFLTDFEILARYLANLIMPISLSAVYFVDPVSSFADVRIYIYVPLILAIFTSTLWIAANRRRALFGWLFLFSTLGPNSNFLIAIPHLMQDRYIYFGTGGFFLVLFETISGICNHLPHQRERLYRGLRFAALAYVLVLVALAAVRGPLWSTDFAIFQDSVNKQPQASFAHYGLGESYAEAADQSRRSPGFTRAQFVAFHDRWIAEWRTCLECPDSERYSYFWEVTSDIVEDCEYRHDKAATEYYWLKMAHPPKGTRQNLIKRAGALDGLAHLRMENAKLDEAYGYADEASVLLNNDLARVTRANVALLLLQSQNPILSAARHDQLLAQAGSDLAPVATDSPYYAQAKELRITLLALKPK